MAQAGAIFTNRGTTPEKERRLQDSAQRNEPEKSDRTPLSRASLRIRAQVDVDGAFSPEGIKEASPMAT
jgi:hypothetical protein